MDRPIGVFDSGIGGLTVVRHIFRHLPNEQVIYFGDTARIPYGNKSLPTLRRFAERDAAFLLSHDVKAILVACNTIAAVFLPALDEILPVPVVGVVEPSARAAVAASRGGRIGIIGTRATIDSGAYPRLIRRLRPDAQVFSVACPLFVPLAEEGYVTSDAADAVIAHYLSELRELAPDTLVLGCSHYWVLAAALQDFVGPDVALVECGEPAVVELARVLAERDLLRQELVKPTHRFFVSDLSTNFRVMANSVLDHYLAAVEEADLSRIGGLDGALRPEQKPTTG
jgi:glutamate racemase